MLKRIFLAVVLCSVQAVAGTIGSRVATAVAETGRARVIVALVDPATTPRAFSAIARLESSMPITHRWPRLGAFAADVDQAALTALEHDPDVLRVDLDTGGTGGDTDSLPFIGGDAAHSRGYLGTGVTVAVIDSGVDRYHTDLASAVVDEQCFCTNSDGTGCCPNSETVQSGIGAAADDQGHGTNVTGIIASRGGTAPVGVAPGARIVAVKVLDSRNAFSSSTQVISAMDWVATHHPEVRVVNMSLLTSALFGGYCDTNASFTIAFARAVAALRANGAVVFACSGNNGSPSAMGAPACVRDVMSVGAVYTHDLGPYAAFNCSDAITAADRVTCFTNSNSTLDLVAPGVRILSTGRGGGLSSFTGTSQATPHAAGVAALLFGIDPTLTPARVEEILISSGKPVLDMRNGATPRRIDAAAAAAAVTAPATRRRAVGRH